MPRKKTITGKKHKGFYIYSRDLLSSQRYRRCSWATKGVYLDLLNVLAVQDHPGALCLRDYDLKPHGERSLTQRCLACQRKAKNGEYQSIKYFAEAIAVSASGSRPGLIHGLQELYMRGIIVIEGDTLLQPRMYRDSGMIVTDFDGKPIDIGDGDYVTVVGSPDDADPDPDAEKMRLGASASDNINNGTQKGGQKGTEKGTKNPRVGAGDAPARVIRVGVGVNNKDNSIGNIGGVGENDMPTVPKAGQPDPTAFWPFWMMYDKRRIGTHWINIAKVYQAWTALTDAERAAAMVFLPRYIAATKAKQWRMPPAHFIEQKAWLTIEFDGDRVRNPHTDNPELPAQPKTPKNTPAAVPDASAAVPAASPSGKKIAVPAAFPAGNPRPSVSANPPSLDEICAYFGERREAGKPLRYISAEQFYLLCENNGWTHGKERRPIMNWKTYAITCDNWRRDHGEQPLYDEQGNPINNETATRHQQGHSGIPTAATGHPTDDELREQSARIIERKLRKDDGDSR